MIAAAGGGESDAELYKRIGSAMITGGAVSGPFAWVHHQIDKNHRSEAAETKEREKKLRADRAEEQRRFERRLESDRRKSAEQLEESRRLWETERDAALHHRERRSHLQTLKDHSGIILPPDENLSNLILVGKCFAGAIAHGATFAGSDLQRVDFRHADLEGVDFAGADLRDVSFGGANLIDADFTDARLDGAKLGKARCERAVFVRTSLYHTDFTDPGDDLASTNGHESADAPERARLPIDERVLQNAYLHPDRGPLEGACFEEADLYGTVFEGLQLGRVKFDNSFLKVAKFTNATFLRGVTFSRAVLRDVYFGKSLLDLDRRDSAAVLKDAELRECRSPLSYNSLPPQERGRVIVKPAR